MLDEIKKIFKIHDIEIPNEKIENFSFVLSKLGEIKQKLQGRKEIAAYDKKILNILKPASDEKQPTLFANEVPEGHFGMASIVADTMNRSIQKIDESSEVIRKGYEIQGNDTDLVTIDMEKNISFRFKGDKDKESIFYFDSDKHDNPGEAFFEFIRAKIKDGSVIQTLCAIWDYANLQESFSFWYVNPACVMELYLKKPANGYFRQSTKRKFTDNIRTLERIEVDIPVIVGKGKRKEQGTETHPLISFKSSPINKNKDIILSLVGSIVPINKSYRARIFPNGIFKLDARTESSRIQLAFRLNTRFSQLNTNEPIEWTREKLIDAAGLAATDNHDKHDASSKLERTLKRIQETGCIGTFNPQKISTNDGEKIKIFPFLKFINIQN